MIIGAGIQDPGIRNQIFLPMISNELGLMEVDGSFISVNEIMKCDNAWREDIHHNLKSYIRYVHSLDSLFHSINCEMGQESSFKMP